MRLLLGVLLPVALCADPITVTITDQVIQSSAFATAFGKICTNTGSVSASCIANGTLQGQTIYAQGAASLKPSGYRDTSFQMTASATAEQGQASSDVRLVENLTVNGGHGTGYIDVAFGVSNYGQNQEETGAVQVNGVYASQVNQTKMAVVPFTFGQAFGFTVDLSAFEAGTSYSPVSSQLMFTGARVYAEEPTGCNPLSGFCSDPSYTDVSLALGDSPGDPVSDAPEPGTLFLMLGPAMCLLLYGLHNRRPNPHLIV